MALRRVQKAFRRLGLAVHRHPAPGTIGYYIRKVLDRKRITVVIDVGAHRGGFCRLLRNDLDYRGRIVSFEPDADSFAALQTDRSGDPWWFGYRLALGDETARLPLHIHAASDFNSLLPASPYGRSQFAEITDDAREAVPVARLADLWDDVVQPGDRVLLKADTQGFDLRVLEGAEPYMHHVDGVVTEAAAQPIYEGMPTMPDMLTRLDRWGFDLIGVALETPDGEAFKAVEFNLVACR